MSKRTGSSSGGARPRPGERGRHLAFAAVVAFVVLLAAGYSGYVAWRHRADAATSASFGVRTLVALPLPDARSAKAERRYLVFVNNALGESFGRLGLADLDGSLDMRRIGALRCDRLHYSAGVGICLESVRKGLASYRAQVFDAKLQVTHVLPLAGPPSRARVSPDGRWAAFTVFVSGHSYDSPGFSTRTSIIDTGSGELLAADLESMPVTRGGEPFQSVDFNFWGVTFASDGATFYATLGTRGQFFLLRGDLRARRMQVIHNDVECPSLSPDGRRVAFKRRAASDSAGRRIWRLHVLDLATGKESLLGREVRNIDDQVEWLNDEEILYALPRDVAQASAATDVWALATSGASAPRLLLPYAFSPSASR